MRGDGRCGTGGVISHPWLRGAQQRGREGAGEEGKLGLEQGRRGLRRGGYRGRVESRKGREEAREVRGGKGGGEAKGEREWRGDKTEDRRRLDKERKGSK